MCRGCVEPLERPELHENFVLGVTSGAGEAQEPLSIPAGADRYLPALGRINPYAHPSCTACVCVGVALRLISVPPEVFERSGGFRKAGLPGRYQTGFCQRCCYMCISAWYVLRSISIKVGLLPHVPEQQQKQKSGLSCTSALICRNCTKTLSRTMTCWSHEDDVALSWILC